MKTLIIILFASVSGYSQMFKVTKHSITFTTEMEPRKAFTHMHQILNFKQRLMTHYVVVNGVKYKRKHYLAVPDKFYIVEGEKEIPVQI